MVEEASRIAEIFFFKKHEIALVELTVTVAAWNLLSFSVMAAEIFQDWPCADSDIAFTAVDSH